MLLMKFLYRFSLPKMNITFSWEVGRGWGGRGEGAGATSTSPKFDLFLFYMNSKHIMKLKITRKRPQLQAPALWYQKKRRGRN